MLFPPFTVSPESSLRIEDKDVNLFSLESENIDPATVRSFGEEWSKFDHFSNTEINTIASEHYFDIVPESYIKGKNVLDVGCGTGRWSKYIAAIAATVDSIDPSDAVISAARLSKGVANMRLSKTTVDNLPFAADTFDFVFSLGVLHHIPDTSLAMKKCVEKLKPGGYFLVYLYYNFDNRSFLFKSLFGLSNLVRKLISVLPGAVKDFLCDVIAVLVYMPFIFLAKCFAKIGLAKLAEKMPLSFYVGKSFNVIRNDARDRFGTPLEQRFTQKEIRFMMEECGLTDIIFSPKAVYWHAIGRKK